MKLSKILVIAVFSGLAFTSCRNNERGLDDDRIEIEADSDADLRTDQSAWDDENSFTARIRRNQNLSIFNEGWTRNQVSQVINRRTNTGTPTGQYGDATAYEETTVGKSGLATNQGTITNKDGTVGDQSSTATGQAGTTGQSANQTDTSAGQTGQEMTGQVTYTIFAPTNDAFASLSENERNEWNSTQNRDQNISMINYLMVAQRITQEDLRQQIRSSNGTFNIRTMQGENITATLDGNNIVLRDAAGNQAMIVETDSQGSNGVIHVIDRVLRPSDVTRNDTRMNTGTNNTGTNTGRTNN